MGFKIAELMGEVKANLRALYCWRQDLQLFYCLQLNRELPQQLTI